MIGTGPGPGKKNLMKRHHGHAGSQKSQRRQGGLRLEEETLKDLRKSDSFGRALVWPLWIIAALLALLLFFG